MLAIDAAAHASVWRRRHPADKAVLALGLLACAVVLPPWPGAVLVAAVALTVLLGPARTPPRHVWRAARAPLAFAVTGAVTLVFSVSGTGVHPSAAGAERAGEVLARSVAGGLSVLVLAFTTPMSDLLPRLTRLGIPAPVVDVAAVMYRMVFLLLDTTTRVHEAQAGRLGHRTRAARWRAASGLGATVFVRALDRARRMQDGLAGRGYDGRLRVLTDNDPVSRPFVTASLALVAGIATATVLTAKVLS